MGCSFSGLNALYDAVNGGGDVWINDNRFRIVRQLGEGGFAYVFLVKELLMDNSSPSAGLAKKLKDPSFASGFNPPIPFRFSLLWTFVLRIGWLLRFRFWWLSSHLLAFTPSTKPFFCSPGGARHFRNSLCLKSSSLISTWWLCCQHPYCFLQLGYMRTKQDHCPSPYLTRVPRLGNQCSCSF